MPWSAGQPSFPRTATRGTGVFRPSPHAQPSASNLRHPTSSTTSGISLSESPSKWQCPLASAFSRSPVGPMPTSTATSSSPTSPHWATWQTTPFDRAQNASLNIQRSLTRSTVLDVGYTGNWGYNQQLSYDLNPIPIGTRAPFSAAAADATNGNKTLPDVLLRTVYPGFNTLNGYAHLGHSNYHALTASVAERMSSGLVVGLARRRDVVAGV